MLNDGGGVIEDLIVYRLEPERFFVVPNASNAPRVLRMLEEEPADDRLHLMYHQDWCFLAVQGPDSVHVMTRPVPGGGRPAFMQCAESEYRRRPVIVTRSGYTGEVGFELFTYQDIAGDLWNDLIEAMAPFGGMPCGLAARDVLRLEMGYPLYGQDLFESSTALEAGSRLGGRVRQGRVPRADGADASARGGPPSRLRGLVMEERRHIPRAHYPVFRGDQLIGEVTSGTFSPILQTGIGLAYLWPADVADVGVGSRWTSAAAVGRRPSWDAVRGPQSALSRTRAGSSASMARGGRSTKSRIGAPAKRVCAINRGASAGRPAVSGRTATTT